MTLNEKLKSFSKSGKAWVLSAAVTMAGIFGAHAQTTTTYTRSSDGHTTITQSSHDKYELRAGVLMPKAGETQKAYEQRRIRLEKQENLLRQHLAENIRRQLADAQTRKLSSRRMEMLEDRLEEHEKKAHYISYFTPEGQQKLKVYNSNPLRAEAVQSNQSQTASVRRGRTYDF